MKTTNIRYETWNTKGKKARWRQQSFSKRMIPLLVFQTENYQQLHTALRMCSRYLFLTISGKYNEQQNSQAFVAFHSFLSLSLSGVLHFFRFLFLLYFIGNFGRFCYLILFVAFFSAETIVSPRKVCATYTVQNTIAFVLMPYRVHGYVIQL